MHFLHPPAGSAFQPVIYCQTVDNLHGKQARTVHQYTNIFPISTTIPSSSFTAGTMVSHRLEYIIIQVTLTRAYVYILKLRHDLMYCSDESTNI